MKTDRPVYLNLFQYRFPVTAISSIFHRISGLLMFLLLPLLLSALACSLSSPANFAKFSNHAYSFWFGFGLWVVLSSIIFHVLAGIRHMMMDIGFGEDYQPARASAYLVMFLSVILIIATGIWLW